MTLLAIDALPVPIRRGVFRPVDAMVRVILRRGGEHPDAGAVHIIAMHAMGQTRAARDEALSLGSGSRTRTAIRAARVALALNEPAVADAILAPYPPADDDRTTTALRGEIDFRIGRYASAIDRLERASRGGHRSPMTDSMIARSRSEMTVLTPGWRPDVGSGPLLTRRVPGRILHLLTNSLPYRQAGYTVRAQSVARCQQDHGLDPVMATRAGFPRNDGVAHARAARRCRRRRLPPTSTGS